MKTIVVRRHFRRKKNGVTTVRNHLRDNSMKSISELRIKHNIKNPIDVALTEDDKVNSYAYTDTHMDELSKMPTKHEVSLAPDKISQDKEHADKILHHELAHILDKEKMFLKTPQGANVLNAIKTTKAYKKLVAANDSYDLKPDELFARAYAQYKTGKAKPEDIKRGYAWDKKDFNSVHKYLTTLNL
jgi:hypothetical protein